MVSCLSHVLARTSFRVFASVIVHLVRRELRTLKNAGEIQLVHTLVPGLGEQKLVDLCEFETNLVFVVSLRKVKDA